MKTVLVTGAAGIIGPAIIERLLADGWKVAAAERSGEDFARSEKLLGRRPGGEHRFTADLRTQEGCKRLVAEVEAALGPLHAVVNNAAVNFGNRFEAMNPADAGLEWSVNFLAPLWIIQAAMPSLLAAGGSVVNMSSVQVVRPLPPSFSYNCTKAALEQATRQLAGEYLDSGVRFNAIRIGQVPGYQFMIKTAEKLPEELAARMVREVLPRHLANSRARSGEPCIGTPEEVASLTAYLLSSESRFINGESILLDGGATVHPVGFGRNPGPSPADLVNEWLKANAPEHAPSNP